MSVAETKLFGEFSFTLSESLLVCFSFSSKILRLTLFSSPRIVYFSGCTVSLGNSDYGIIFFQVLHFDLIVSSVNSFSGVKSEA